MYNSLRVYTLAFLGSFVNAFMLHFYNGSLIFSNYLPYRHIDLIREETLTYMIKRAFSESHEDLSNCVQSFKIIASDTDRDEREPEYFGQYLMSSDINKTHEYPFTGPDWTFVHWPGTGLNDFEQIVRLSESQKEPKINKVAWFGNIRSPHYSRVEATTRPQLIQISKEYPELFDFRDTCWNPDPTCGHISHADMISKYAYLLDIGGNGYSGRLKYLLFSKRPLFYVYRPFVEYFNYDLIPNYHYIPVNRDLSNLVNQTKWAMSNPDQALRIAMNAFAYAKENLTISKVNQRIRNVILSQCHEQRSKNPDQTSINYFRDYMNHRYKALKYEQLKRHIMATKMITDMRNVKLCNPSHIATKRMDIPQTMREFYKEYHTTVFSELSRNVLCIVYSVAVKSDMDELLTRVISLNGSCNVSVIFTSGVRNISTAFKDRVSSMEYVQVFSVFPLTPNLINGLKVSNKLTPNPFTVSKFLYMTQIIPLLANYATAVIIYEDVNLRNFNMTSFLSTYQCGFAQKPIIAQPLYDDRINTLDYLSHSKWINKSYVAVEVKYIHMNMIAIDSLFLAWYLKHIISSLKEFLYIFGIDYGIDAILCSLASKYVQHALGNDHTIPCVALLEHTVGNIHPQTAKEKKVLDYYKLYYWYRDEMFEIVKTLYGSDLNYGLSVDEDPLFPDISKHLKRVVEILPTCLSNGTKGHS